ncbi:DUF1501 domain-containing protein [Marinicellulosiphila megalodicopiae]|uniref:DUF1501 domain-containing protein n=1 Tax=Marinicellulosiphila megalodicopiae TaxID=2724896 RepID=UPI003BB03513
MKNIFSKNKKTNAPKLNRNISRRDILKNGMSGAAAFSLRSMATGLPVGFLLSGAMPAYAAQAKDQKLILAMSDDGESINCYAPGTYSSDASNALSTIERPTTAQLGTGVLGTINGNDVTALDFSEMASFNLGDTQVDAARYLSYLPEDLRERLGFFHLRTAANGHPEGPNVHGVHGGLTAVNGRGVEEIQSALMQEMQLNSLNHNSLLTTPMVLGNGRGLATLKNEGIAITRYSPLDIKNLFLGGEASVDLNNMKRLYENTIDSMYRDIKQNGSTAQMNFLDAHALSRSQAVILGEELGDLLSSITGETNTDQALASVGLIKANLAPVVVIRYAFSGDNHSDTDLSGEVAASIEQTNAIVQLWDLLKTENLQDDINFATYDIFGRTFGRNSEGGRDHHNSHCTNFMFGSNVKAGVVGGVEAWDNSGIRIARASGINSTTGLMADADISLDETLVAYCRTLMAMQGIPEERIAIRLPSSKTVYGALKS